MSKSQVLVIVQFSCIAYFVYRGGAFADHVFYLMIELLGILIGLWAIVAMRIGNLSVFPEPKVDAELKETGPYRWVRHPMYTAVLLVTGAMALEAGGMIDGAVFAVLLANQWIKLRHEEELLRQKFPTYAEYMERTKALIPFFI